MTAFTAQALIDRGRVAADMADDFVTPATWLTWLNVERMALERFVAQCGYVLAEQQQSITANGAAAYVIPGQLAIIGVYEYLDGRYRRLRTADLFDGPAGRDYASTGAATTYRVAPYLGDQLQVLLHPLPQSGSYKVVCINEPTVLTLLADVVNYPLGWEERLVLGMARRALAKEETVNRAIEDEIARLDSHIEETAWNRIFASSGAAVRNVDRVERGWTPYPQIPSRDYWMFT